MRYHVLYLAAGDREATHVEAPDAATAVAMVNAMQQQRTGRFELLRVMPVPVDALTELSGTGRD